MTDAPVLAVDTWPTNAGQGDVCAVCGTDTPGGMGNAWNVDHDHGCCPGAKTCSECVRGILCGLCNRRPGIVENETWLASAIAYLKGK